MKSLLVLVLLISVPVFGKNKCKLVLKNGETVLRKKNFKFKRKKNEPSIKFGKLKDEFYTYVIQENPRKSMDINLSTYVEYTEGKMTFIDLIVEAKTDIFIRSISSGVISQVRGESHIKNFSLKLDKGTGEKVYKWGDGLSLEFSCKN